MNFAGNSLTLNDAAGQIGASPASAIGIALKSALTGSLTITGVAQANGSPQAWTIAPGSTGYQAAPGAGHTGGGRLNYSLSNVGADAGKAVALFEPR